VSVFLFIKLEERKKELVINFHCFQGSNFYYDSLGRCIQNYDSGLEIGVCWMLWVYVGIKNQFFSLVIMCFVPSTVLKFLVFKSNTLLITLGISMSRMSFEELIESKHPTAWIEFEKGMIDEVYMELVVDIRLLRLYVT
jgi:hypothetical protein